LQVIIYCATVQWKVGQLLARLEEIIKRTRKKVYNLSDTARQSQGSGAVRWGKKPMIWRGFTRFPSPLVRKEFVEVSKYTFFKTLWPA